MENDEVHRSFDPLYAGSDDVQEVIARKPLFAHYTSLDALEKILTSREIWFSNPLFMNDLEEVRFGVLRGTDEIIESKDIAEAFGSRERNDIFLNNLIQYKTQFEDVEAFDTYVFCVSEHNPKNEDGLLSMWRGYGGNGKGAAIIFDSERIPFSEGGVLILGKVHYASKENRIEYIRKIASVFSNIVKSTQINDSQIYIAAHAIFQRIVLFALFSKHHGFLEEQEWRLVYLSARDSEKKFELMKNYFNGPRGMEPKLRLEIRPGVGAMPSHLFLEDMIHSIILGPNSSSKLALRSVERMLDILKLSELKGRLKASEIPLRDA